MTQSESPTAAELRALLECVVLPPRADATPSERPPVEIFLGTEPAQYRANRVFGWSIEKVRDPGREVRIHLMSELPGFDRRAWTTGFTNYRFAIPALAGGRGRAIYNDEDEIYLTDPGALFDLELGTAGYLAISDTESSVMLIDCERMSEVWSLEEAQRGWKRSLLRKASGATGHRGELDPRWNARDEEFEPGRSHLLHYTTLHTQPWRPFPERFVYQTGSYTELWHDLEREAIAAGFDLFERARPSKRFAALRARLERLPAGELPSGVGSTGEVARALEPLARQAKCRSWIELLPDLRGEADVRTGRFGVDLERRAGLLEWLAAFPDAEAHDGVVCAGGLEDLPVWDIPWVIDTLFARARRFVFAAVRCRETPRRRFLYPPAGTAFTPDWWRSHFEAASARHPHVRWELLTTLGLDFAAAGRELAFGGPRLDLSPPRIWTLSDGEPGDDAQGAALATALGGAALTAGAFDPALVAPWPDLVIAAGRNAGLRARQIRGEAHGRTLVVAIGADAVLPIAGLDLAVMPRGEAVFTHPRLVEVDGALVSPPSRAARASAVANRVAGLPGLRVAVRLDADARHPEPSAEEIGVLAARVVESAERLRASIVLSGSSRCSPAAFEALHRALGPIGFAQRADGAAGVGDAWPAIVSTADLFIVAGATDALLGELGGTSRPVFVWPAAPPRQGGLFERLLASIAEAIVTRARARPANDRGTTRPQEGLEWLCARLVADGRVRRRGDGGAALARLVAAGRARAFASPLDPGDLEGFQPAAVSDLDRVTRRVEALLGVPPKA